MDNLKLKISTKILDLVEGLPRFRKGTISSLQDIRERQKKWSSKEFNRRNAPKESKIELNQITLILTFEHEDFHNAIKGLKQYFPKNEKIQKFVTSLKESVDKLHASSWHNLGYIAREKGVYLPDVAVDERLPIDVENVSLSFHRITPSVACVMFDFQLNDSVSKALSKIQDQVYLGPVEFKKLWPLSSLHHAYTMGTGGDCAIKFIDNEKDSVRTGIEAWVKKGFGWKPKKMDAVSYIDIYKISGNPIDIDERRNWLREYTCWLDEYGIDANGFDTLEGEDFLVSRPRSREQKYMVSDVVARFESKGESEFGDFFDYKVRAIAVSSTIFSVIEKYRNKIEILRGHGFKNLYKRKKLTRRNQYNIQELKRSIVIISRLEHEIKQSAHWIAHSISEVGGLISLIRNETVDLGKSTIDNANYQLKQVKEAAAIIDSGLTNYLSVQSIYVMYKLQKWMFILSIVVTIATIIGVLSGWNNLKLLVSGWIDA
ncbi:MAG: hypothetical protein IBX64_12570 [Actinobacteria bacterium]|nr:hypothetical protein [Actinomycetota bacterium]